MTIKPEDEVVGGWNTPLVNREAMRVLPVVLCVRCEYVTGVDKEGLPPAQCPRCDFGGYSLHVKDLSGVLERGSKDGGTDPQAN